MKIAEALVERAHCVKALNEVRERMTTNLVVDEGETPEEDVNALWADAQRLDAHIQALTEAINRSNAVALVQVRGASRPITIMEAVARRDALDRQIGIARVVLQQGRPEARYRGYSARTKDEIKQVVAVNMKEWRTRHDQLAVQRAALDMALQAANWEHTLVGYLEDADESGVGDA